MPDTRQHRGPHPEDAELFARGQWPALQAAAADFTWLLDRGYASESSLKLVGDRYGLRQRQRMAIIRGCASTEQIASRQARLVALADATGRPLWIDGYNVLLTIEAALGGAVILAATDGTCRDLASVHGTYRRVAETTPAIALLSETLARIEIGPCRWLLDKPVSNSGRLAAILREEAAARGWNWEVELVDSPDRELIAFAGLIATADSAILDRCRAWLNLARVTLEGGKLETWMVPLS